MDAKTYVQRQVASMHNLVDAALEGLTDEQLSWIPPGTANPIGLTVLHMLASEDKFISILNSKPRIWESQGWSGTFNLAEPPGFGEDWTTLRHATLTVASLLAYQVVVRVEMEFLLEAMIPETLDNPVRLFTDHDCAADVLVLLINHTMLHAGEMAALKGIYGMKGLRF